MKKNEKISNLKTLAVDLTKNDGIKISSINGWFVNVSDKTYDCPYKTIPSLPKEKVSGNFIVESSEFGEPAYLMSASINVEVTQSEKRMEKGIDGVDAVYFPKSATFSWDFETKKTPKEEFIIFIIDRDIHPTFDEKIEILQHELHERYFVTTSKRTEQVFFARIPLGETVVFNNKTNHFFLA